ncbi:hypothetical protein OG585_49885 (plasmid) [Streptomyces sp. NBC_01340]|uniref:hypothetical protein n=1 Tax=Streptomyces sp. NBC_01340 TaxID=2903830 RepID=UPI002E11A87E|nr:hypothetical protein OG585_49885 [Streptomyces sp. NBC_01340]
MSRTRVRAEDLFCARCRRAVRLGAAHWPEGYLCAGCYAQALETYGTCTGCGVDRLTPGPCSGRRQALHRLRRRPGQLHLLGDELDARGTFAI